MKAYKKLGAAVVAIVVGLGLAGSAFADSTADFKNILSTGLLGAGVGAISAGASGGEAGKGALIGAGTNVIGSALLGFLTSAPTNSQPTYAYAPQAQPVYTAPPQHRRYEQPRRVYVQPVPQPVRRQIIVREYDASGNVLSQREFWEQM